MSNSSQNQSSNQQQLGTGDYIVSVQPRDAAAASYVLKIYSEPEVSETTKLPEKRKPIEFDKTMDLMLGIEENSL